MNIYKRDSITEHVDRKTHHGREGHQIFKHLIHYFNDYYLHCINLADTLIKNKTQFEGQFEPLTS